MAFKSGYIVLWVVASICVLPPMKALDLPGVFSSQICSDANLNTSIHVRPVCECMSMYNISNLDDMCKNYEEFGSCLATASLDNVGGFFEVVYGPRRFKMNMKFVCERKEVMATVQKYSIEILLNYCDEQLATDVYNLTDQVDLQGACALTSRLGKCYWKALQRCPVAARHVWTKLAEAIEAWDCTRFEYEAPEHRDCSKLPKLYSADNTPEDRKKQCLDAIEITTTCFTLETLQSHRSTDKWTFMNFDKEKFKRYSVFSCELAFEREFHCDRDVGICWNNYQIGYINHVAIMELGNNVTVGEVCSVYHNLTDCIKEKIDKRCPIAERHYMALLCAAMPTDCNCPIKAEFTSNNEHGPTSSTVSYSSALTNYTYSFLALMAFLTLLLTV